MLKLNLKMKISMLFMFLVLFTMQANSSYAQRTKITLNLQNVTVERFIDEIESKTDFHFVYQIKEVDLNRVISVKANKELVTNILERIFDNTRTTHNVVDKQIFLKERGVLGSRDNSIYQSVLDNLQATVSGQIVDDNGTPLSGANIVEKGTTNGVTADFDGNFTIEVASGDAVLVVSYIGFATKEVQVNGQTGLSIVLEESAAGLDEVVLIGYGEVRRKDLTGSVSKVGGADLENLPVARIDQSLQGRASGVQVSQISGEPGAATTIRIRGGNSIQGNNEPLWVIDGVIVGTDYNLSNLNTNDIQSIDILKDAVAVSIYGTRGANGVILVTTKSGAGATPGVPNVSVNAYTGLQSMVTQVEFLDGPQHAAYANEDAEFRNAALPFPDLSSVPDVDWIDQVTHTAPVQNIDVSVSGVSENRNINYYVSGNYFDQEGLVRATGISKYVFRTNLDIKLSEKFKVGMRVNIAKLKKENNKFSLDNLFLFTTPTRAIYDEEGNYTALDPITDGIASNYEADIQLKQDHNLETNILGNLYMEFRPFSNLVFKTTFSPELNSFKRNIFNPGALPNNLIVQNGGNAEVRNSVRTSYINENTLTYNKTIGQDDYLTVLAGFTLQKTEQEESVARAFQISNDVTGFNNLGFGSNPTRNEVVSGYDSFQLASWLGRINFPWTINIFSR